MDLACVCEQTNKIEKLVVCFHSQGKQNSDTKLTYGRMEELQKDLSNLNAKTKCFENFHILRRIQNVSPDIKYEYIIKIKSSIQISNRPVTNSYYLHYNAIVKLKLFIVSFLSLFENTLTEQVKTMYEISEERTLDTTDCNFYLL